MPPPGLKSRQTTPLIPPWSGSGLTAWTASSGISLALTPVRPSEATSPGLIGFSSVRPPAGVPVRSSVDGFAEESTPGGLT